MQGKRALVTGASRGIGEAVALALAAAGADLVLAARTEADLNRVADACRASGAETEVVATDARDETALERLAARSGRVDVLVNNAGLGYFAAVHELSLAHWDEMFAVNLRAAFYLTHLVVPRMIETGQGDIVNVASIAGIRAYARGVGYNATKFALRGFSEALQRDLRPHGIRVIVVSPALVHTHFFDGRRGPDTSKHLQPEDVAGAIIHALTLPRRATMRELIMFSAEQDW